MCVCVSSEYVKRQSDGVANKWARKVNGERCAKKKTFSTRSFVKPELIIGHDLLLFSHELLLFSHYGYGVAMISRLLKIIGLLCRIYSLLQGSFATATYNLKEPTNRSHPIWVLAWLIVEQARKRKSAHAREREGRKGGKRWVRESARDRENRTQ